VLNLDNKRKTLSDLYDMNRIHNSVRARSLRESNALYSSSTMSDQRKDRCKNNMIFL
jgi:hypothetical protein